MTARALNAFVSCAGALLVSYFLYHTMQGDRGWLAMARLQKEVAVAQDTLSHLQKDRQALEHRVKLMRPGSLDPDLLEEKSREMLDYSKSGDIVILTPGEKDRQVNGNTILQRSK
ncbi:MAG: septum formation initiator family protein [Bdellovibrionales bacterium]